MSYLVVSYEVKQSSPAVIENLNAELRRRGFQKAGSGGETTFYRDCGVGAASEAFIDETQRAFDEAVRGSGRAHL